MDGKEGNAGCQYVANNGVACRIGHHNDNKTKLVTRATITTADFCHIRNELCKTRKRP